LIKHDGRVWVKNDNNGTNNYGDAVVNANRLNELNPGLINILTDYPASHKAGRLVYFPAISQKVLDKQLKDINDKLAEGNEDTMPITKLSEKQQELNKEKTQAFSDEVSNRQGEIVPLLGFLKKDVTDLALLDLINMLQQKVKGKKEFFAVKVDELEEAFVGRATLMQIGENGRTILINESELFGPSYDYITRAFVHEVMHMYTVEATRRPETTEEKEFSEKINGFFKTAKKNTKHPGLDAYRFDHAAEFVADALTDKKLIKDLKEQPYNILRRIWNAILKFFKQSQSTDFYDKISSTIYDFVEDHAIFKGPNAILTYRKVIEEQETESFQDEDLKGFIEKGKDVSVLQALNTKAIKNLELRRKILVKSGKPKEVIQRQQRIINKTYDSLSKLRGAITFVKESANVINTEYNSYMQNEKRFQEGNYKFTVRGLSRMYDTVEGFDLLEEYRTMFHLEKGLIPPSSKSGNWKSFYELLDITIGRKNTMKAVYEYRGLDLLVDFLEPHFNGLYRTFEIEAGKAWNKLSKTEQAKISKEDYVARESKGEYSSLKERTRTLIRQELKKAKGDINVLTRYMDNMLDTRDIIAAAIVEKISMVDRQGRNESVQTSDIINDVLQDLEKAFPHGAFTDLREIYDFMLEKEGTEYTQHYITPWSSKLMQTWFDLVEETKHLKEEERDEVRREWKDQNVPLDKEAFNAAKDKYISSLVDNGDMTAEEWDTYTVMESIYMKRGKINQVIKDLTDGNNLNQDAGELISTWIYQNVWNYRNPAHIWRNPQWEGLVTMAGGDLSVSIPLQREQVKENITKDPRISFYNVIVSLNEEANRNLPYNFRINSRLPGMEKHSAERYAEGQSASQIFEAARIMEFTVRPDETKRGNVEMTDVNGNIKYFLPIHFTNKVELDDQSWDIPTLYNEFWKMANHYKLKNEILPEAEMTKYFIDKRDAIIRDKKGEAKKVWYGPVKDYINKPKGKTLIADQYNDWMLMVMYGKKEKDEGSFKIRKGKLSKEEQAEQLILAEKEELTEKEKKRFDKLNKKSIDVEIDWAKLGDFINKYTALNLLGLNFTQGTANVILGETLQMAEAIAGEYINLKSYHKANKVYLQHLPSMLADIGLRRPKNVISLLIERFDILHEYEGITFRKSTRFRQLMTSNTMFFMQEAGEHYMQGRFLLAFLDNKRALDKDGNDIGSMLDNYITVDGKLKLKDKVDIEKSEWSEEQLELFGKKVRAVLSRLHGEYSDLGRVAIQRMALGRMAYMFRKFVIPGYKRRWQKAGYTQRLDDVVEGNYQSMGRFLGTVFKDMATLKFHLMGEKWNMLTKHEKANIHRTLVEVNFLIAAIIMANIALRLRGESDDDREEQWWSFAAYQMLRLRAELLFFTPKIDEAMSILRSPMASISLLENSTKLMGQLFDPITSGTFQFDRYTRGPWKDKPKIQRTLIQMTPGMKQMYRMRDIGSQTSFFQN